LFFQEDFLEKHFGGFSNSNITFSRFINKQNITFSGFMNKQDKRKEQIFIACCFRLFAPCSTPFCGGAYLRHICGSNAAMLRNGTD